MTASPLAEPAGAERAAGREPKAPYILDDQVGFLLRQVHQAHAALFAAEFGEDVTPTQWAAVAKLHEVGPCSQNHLGRLTAMDVATIKGVVDRLAKRGYAEIGSDPLDKRRVLVALTPSGRDLHRRYVEKARRVTARTLAPLPAHERATLVRLLKRLRPGEDSRPGSGK